MDEEVTQPGKVLVFKFFPKVIIEIAINLGCSGGSARAARDGFIQSTHVVDIRNQFKGSWTDSQTQLAVGQWPYSVSSVTDHLLHQNAHHDKEARSWH